MIECAGAGPAGFFVIRTPLLPFDKLLAWGQGLEAPTAPDDPERLEEALTADRARLRQRLRAITERPDVRDALFVASPDLDKGLAYWQADPDSDRGRRVELALVRYVERMAGRTTPFGLFAGCSVGTIGPATGLALDDRATYRRHTRLDMGYLAGLVHGLERDPVLRDALTYRPNASLHRLAGWWRYFRSQADEQAPTHQAVWIEPIAVLEAVLARAATGARPGPLADALVEHGLAGDEADAYLEDLIERELLVSELRPAVTGPEPIGGLIATLRRLAAQAPAAQTASERLEEAEGALAAIDAAGIGVEPARYRAVAELLADLPGRIDPARLFQVDLVPGSSRATLGGEPLVEIGRGVELLRRLARPAHDSLARFREAFVARYEGREVPLLEALDHEVGVGFGRANVDGGESPALLDGLRLPARSDERNARWGPRHAVLLAKLADALARGSDEIVLDPGDVERMADREPLPLPDAFAVTAVVAAESDAGLARGDFQVLLSGVAGPSGARLLGRFCHADARLSRLVTEHLGDEEATRPDAIFAEIVHLPDGRTGNIIHRPVLRGYEITYLGRSGAPLDRQIPIQDLLVSVRGERIVLRSARLGREVVPRMTTAQNYFHPRADAVYRFLCALQTQGVAGALDWDWGVLASAPFVPRVRSGRLVLSRACWRVDRDELRALGEATGAARFRAVQRWRERRRLPRQVALADSDNELLVDLDNVLSVESFVQLVKGREQAILVQPFPPADRHAAHGPEGRFVHGLVIPFVALPTPESVAGAASGEASRPRVASGRSVFRAPHVPEGSARAPAGSALPRASGTAGADGSSPCSLPGGEHGKEWGPCAFPPGSEWLYARLYMAPAVVDRVLRDQVRPLVDEALGSGAADGWFFLRYGDPDWHLRLRFHGDPDRLNGKLRPMLETACATLLADGRARRVELGTYEPELDRYGGPVGIALAERLFQADSEAALAVVEAILGHGNLDRSGRWRLALLGMDRLLDDLGLDLETGRALLKEIRDGYAAELRVDAAARRHLGDTYRQERAALETLFEADGHDSGPLGAALAALRRRSERLAPIVAELRAAERAGQLTVPLADLAPSFLHVHANRLLRTVPRPLELILYELLGRLYESRLARTRGADAVTSTAG